jgi:hypothetical protein
MRFTARLDARVLPALLFMLAMLTAGCAPREQPPQLDYTAGPPFTLTDSKLITERYRISTPTGWRVISGPAENPYTFQFVRQDNRALIAISPAPFSEMPLPLALTDLQPASMSLTREIDAGLTLYMVVVADPDSLPDLQSLAQSLLETAH